jgi:hypothetical protein
MEKIMQLYLEGLIDLKFYLILKKLRCGDNLPQPWSSGEPLEVLADKPHDIKKFFESIETGERGFERHSGLKP